MLSLLLLLSAPALPSAATPALSGAWITPDKSIVQVYPCSTSLCIRIARVDPSVGHSTDGKNPDAAKRSRPLCGLVIGSGFTSRDGKVAEGGKLYDPESGNTYSGTLTLADDTTLKLRGFIGISLFGRSETWHRTAITPSACS